MSRNRRAVSGSGNPAPLIKTKGQLQARSNHLSSALSQCLGAPSTSLQAFVEFAPEVAVAELQGEATEQIRGRNWGGQTQVARLCDLGSIGPAWVGLRERWVSVPAKGGRPSFAFESASITIYAGEIGTAEKAQLMRAEWAGYTNRGGTECFQAGGAGHPHWQIDVLETLRNIEEDAARFGETPALRDFGAQPREATYKSQLLVAPFERFHFASAAHWWRSEQEGQSRQQHAPNDDDDLSRWIIATIEYVRDQLHVVSRGMS